MTSPVIYDVARLPMFSYRPLEEDDGIRLLQLNPGSFGTTEVHCEVIHTRLSICKDIYDDYTALSYVWGDLNDTKTILLHGQPHSITINLYNALRDLRHERRPLLLWVDAVCINQSDDDEKMKQIVMMGKIYSTASHTVIYLGPLEAQDDNKWRDWVSVDLSVAKFSTEMATYVLEREWFQRVWVFQELIFSENPIVQIGRFRLPWTTLYQLISRHFGEAFSHSGGEIRQLFTVFDSMHKARQSNRSVAKTNIPNNTDNDELVEDELISREDGNSDSALRLPMAHLLHSRRGLKATVPKDMIFAHIGIASDGKEIAARVDYSMSCAQVCEAFARYLQESALSYNRIRYQLFYQLHDIDCSERVEGLASWAPDWTKPGTDNGLPTPGTGWKGSSIERSTLPFHFARDSQDRITWIMEPAILGCVGLVADVVVRCSSPLSDADALFIDHRDLVLKYLSARQSLQKSFDINDTGRLDTYHQLYTRVYTDIWRTVISDEAILPRIDQKYSSTFMRHLSWKNQRRYPKSQDNFDNHSTVVQHLMHTYCSARTDFEPRRMRVALMASGRLAFVPGLTQPGDVLAALEISSDTSLYQNCRILRPIATKVEDFEAPLKERFPWPEIPVYPCTLVGEAWMEVHKSNTV